jgi:hypothetical protein
MRVLLIAGVALLTTACLQSVDFLKWAKNDAAAFYRQSIEADSTGRFAEAYKAGLTSAERRIVDSEMAVAPLQDAAVRIDTLEADQTTEALRRRYFTSFDSASDILVDIATLRTRLEGIDASLGQLANLCDGFGAEFIPAPADVGGMAAGLGGSTFKIYIGFQVAAGANGGMEGANYGTSLVPESLIQDAGDWVGYHLAWLFAPQDDRTAYDDAMKLVIQKLPSKEERRLLVHSSCLALRASKYGDSTFGETVDRQIANLVQYNDSVFGRVNAIAALLGSRLYGLYDRLSTAALQDRDWSVGLDADHEIARLWDVSQDLDVSEDILDLATKAHTGRVIALASADCDLAAHLEEVLDQKLVVLKYMLGTVEVIRDDVPTARLLEFYHRRMEELKRRSATVPIGGC